MWIGLPLMFTLPVGAQRTRFDDIRREQRGIELHEARRARIAHVDGSAIRGQAPAIDQDGATRRAERHRAGGFVAREAAGAAGRAHLAASGGTFGNFQRGIDGDLAVGGSELHRAAATALRGPGAIRAGAGVERGLKGVAFTWRLRMICSPRSSAPGLAGV